MEILGVECGSVCFRVQTTLAGCGMLGSKSCQGSTHCLPSRARPIPNRATWKELRAEVALNGRLGDDTADDRVERHCQHLTDDASMFGKQ